MREASFYAFRGWVALEDVALQTGAGNAPVPPESAPDVRKSIEARRETGRRFVEHYAAVVKEIHDHTSKGLFKPVKSELQQDLINNKQYDRAKTLPLIERHVRELQARGSLNLEELIEQFPNLPEMQ